MKEILFISSGVLPIPATSGGAVERIIEDFLTSNEKEQDLKITLISGSTDSARKKAKNFKLTEFIYTSEDTIIDNLCRAPTKILRRIIEKTTGKTIFFNEYPKIIRAAKNIIKKKHFDKVVIINYGQMILPLDKCISNDTQKILYLHNDNLNPGVFFARKIVKKFDKIITISDFLKKQIEELNIERGPIVKTVRTGIKKIHIDKNKVIKLREKLGFSQDDFVVVYVGRIHPLKGVQFPLKALKYLPENFKLLIVGGIFYDTKVRSMFLRDLKRSARKFPKRVVFTGFVDHLEVPNYIALSDAMIVPSIVNEALGVTVMEAQLYGTALICSNRGGIPEVRTDKSSIMLNVDENFSKRIAEKELLLAENPSLRKKMIEEGVKFSNNFMFKDFYQKLKKELLEDESNETKAK